MKSRELQGIPAALARQSDSFIGREWAMAEIASWYETAEPLLVVTGEPGVGKSTLATRLVQVSLDQVVTRQGLGPGWLHAWHFCQAQYFSSLDIRGALEQVAGQLCSTLPGYAEAVAYHASGTIVTVNQQFTGPVRDSAVIGVNRLVLPEVEPRHLLDSLLRKPLSDLGAHAVVLFDAVDETEERIGEPPTLARLLSELRTDPIPGLRLVLTTRNGPTAECFSHGRQLRLRDDEPAGTDDVRTYLQGRLRDRRITDPLLVARLIAHAADGNFLYATLAASEDAEWLRLLASGGRVLPHGLADLYSSFLDRQVTVDPRRWREVIRPVLGLLVQSRGNGFTRRQLARLSGLHQSAVDDALELCAPYLRGLRPDGPFLPFHGSLREHLRSESRHGVYPGESTERIAAEFRADTADPHGVEHLLSYMADRVQLMASAAGGEHAAERGGQQPREVRELDESVTSCDYLGARIAVTGVESLLNEVTALHERLPESRVLGLVRGILGRQAHNLRGAESGPTVSFIAQQLLYECAVSGHSGLLRLTDSGHGHVIATLWSAASGNSRLLSHTLATAEYTVEAAAMSEDGTRTALCGFTFHGNDMHKTVRVFDTETGSEIRKLALTENEMRVSDLRFSDGGRLLTAQRIDRTGVVWELSSGTGKPLPPDEFTEIRPSRHPPELPPYIAPGWADGSHLAEWIVVMTPDHRYAVVCTDARVSVNVWDLTNRTILGNFTAELVRSLAISPDGRWVLVGSAMGGAHVLSPLSPASGLRLDGHRGTVRTASLRGGSAATVGNDGELKIWDAVTGRVLQTLSTVSPSDRVDALAVDDEASRCVLGTGGGNAIVLDSRLRELVRPLMLYGTPCDEHWETRDGACDEALPPVGAADCPREHWPTRVNSRHGSPVSALDISPDGRRVVTGTLNGVVRVWDVATGDLVREVTRDGDLVRAVRFTPDGDDLITVAQLGGHFRPRWEGVEKWSLDTGELTQVLWPTETHPHFLLPDDDGVAALTRDGRYLATGHTSGTISVHDLAARERIGRLMLHGAITCLSFDGTRLLAGTANGDVTLTDLRLLLASAADGSV